MDISNLTLEDCMCSICMCIFVEPVTMPCTHTLCMPCFKQNVEATSLTCPLCRKRISTWARKAARDKVLVNQALWKKIQDMFPDKIEKRLEGEDQEDESSMDVYQPIINIAQPGEIRQEYEEQLKRLERERELERIREQEASEALIRKLEAEQKVKSVEQQLIEEKDQELAKELENVVNEAGTDSPFNLLLKESRNRLTRSRGSSVTSPKNSPLTIESFLNKMREAEKLKEADRSASRSSVSPYPYMCLTPSDKDKLSVVTVSSRTSMQSSTSCTSYNTDADVEWEVVTNNDVLFPPVNKPGAKVNTKTNISSTSVRSSSNQSCDSINPELNHFKPIRSCPVTPPKKLASGKIMEAPLIRTTPRNLSGSFSPSNSMSLSDIDGGSPIIQRRLSELGEERKLHVEQNSKSTETADEKKNDISKYFNKKCANKETSENNQNSHTGSIPLKKVIIPLEPIFDKADDIKDFDDVMAPLMEIHNIQKNVSGKDKPLKVRHRNFSKQENISNNSILSPQRSIKDWLSQTESKEGTNNLTANTSQNEFIDRDSKEGILDLNVNQNSHKRDKLKLKKYPKRKHTAYHVSDYVYPPVSPKKRRVYIELSSDEEMCPSDSEKQDLSVSQDCTSKTVDMKASKLRKKSKKVPKSRKTGIKTLKSTKSKHHDKLERTRTMQTYLQSNNNQLKNRNCDEVFKETKNSSEKLRQEEADRQLALHLEKLFKLEEKSRCSAIRIKGSENEYNFRRKSKLTCEDYVL